MITKCMTCGRFQIGDEAEWQELADLPVDLQELIREMDAKQMLSHGLCPVYVESERGRAGLHRGRHSPSPPRSTYAFPLPSRVATTRGRSALGRAAVRLCERRPTAQRPRNHEHQE